MAFVCHVLVYTARSCTDYIYIYFTTAKMICRRSQIFYFYTIIYHKLHKAQCENFEQNNMTE